LPKYYACRSSTDHGSDLETMSFESFYFEGVAVSIDVWLTLSGPLPVSVDDRTQTFIKLGGEDRGGR
jgi:hypothetical protein